MTIESVAYGGAGVGRTDGLVVFVPFTIPGEQVKVRAVRSKRRFCEAELLEVENASPLRQPPVCKLFGTCGGCAYQHVPYPVQLDWKANQVRDLLQRIGGIAEPPMTPLVPSPQTLAYRNRIRVHAVVQKGTTQVGFFAKNRGSLVDVDTCPIACDGVNAELAVLRRSKPVPGEYTLSSRPEVRFFEQTNDGAARKLADLVQSLVPAAQNLLVDAYSGAGFFGSLLSDRCERVIGIESNREAVEAARERARANETYLCGDVALHLPGILAEADTRKTTVLLDPPAAGLAPAVIEALGKTRVSQLLYVSCDPATIARDIKLLAGSGYRLATVVPLDMFPQTADVEVVASLVAER